MQDQIQRMLTYDRIEEAARSANMPQIQWLCQRYKHNLEKSAWSASASSKTHAVLRRGLLLRQKETLARLGAERRQARFRRKMAANIKARKAAARINNRLLQEKRKAQHDALEKVAHDFNAQNCDKGGYGKTALQMRKSCMQRMELCCPELPLELKVRYKEVVEWYANPFPH